MEELVLALAIIGACLFWTAWREHRQDNRRDSALMTVIGLVLAAGSAAAALVA
ncbi:hypothetical protein [Massilia sp.]|uniref:hypothetical protein n=1 Tax=Massilia sp. TaxID=1882437 RepID=UPI0028B1C230|nr:hypothetical protein [Massilia sp.]